MVEVLAEGVLAACPEHGLAVAFVLPEFEIATVKQCEHTLAWCRTQRP